MSEQVESKKGYVKSLFVRCLDCDKFYDLTCDTAVSATGVVSSGDFQRFAEFLVQHSGHRIVSKSIKESH